MELKTLDDMGEQHMGSFMIFPSELKKEAIKWIKRLQAEARGETEWSFFYHDEGGENPTVRWIQHFFNITEEDLNE